MKKTKLYNVIFPIWFIIILPLYWLALLPINFVIDSIVLLIILKLLKLNIKNIYKKTILKVWLFGFLADIAGAIFIFIISLLPISNFFENIYWNPYKDLSSFILMLISFIISTYLIYVFNKKISLKKIDITEQLKKRIALFLALFTAPYLFLIPTKTFYNYNTNKHNTVIINKLNKQEISNTHLV